MQEWSWSMLRRSARARELGVEALFLLVVAIFSGGVPRGYAADGSDPETASHASEAAEYQLIDRYEFPGFSIAQFDLAVLSHYSYMLFSGGECIVVDPGRDIATYLAAAEKEKARIVGVWLTHSHADFVAGHIEFASQLGVPLHISGRANAAYQHVALGENDTLTVGKAVVRFLETPGHTPDSMCGVVTSVEAPERPLALLTGDTLFVGSVGRPDLLGEDVAAATLASMMFDTWTQKLSLLPDDVMILPAHGAGSLCGADLGDDPVSTIGSERAGNVYLQYQERGAFIAAILAGLSQAPPYFSHNAALNRQGPEPVDWALVQLPLVEPSRELTDPNQNFVVDLRDADAYSRGHIPNCINIALRGRFETWIGTMVPWGAQVVLVGSESELKEGVRRLHRIGYHSQCIPFKAWQAAGLPLSGSELITPQQLHQQLQTPDAPLVVDVRLPAEWMASRIGTVVNVPIHQLSQELTKFDKSQRIVAVCNSAYRSSMALGLFQRAGFEHISSLAGGGEAWIKAELPVVGTSCQVPAVSGAPGQAGRLPDRISADELNRLLLDLPGSVQVYDIRPADQFADYRVPGSENVEWSQLLNDSAYLAGSQPLIVVDRDGSVAMMVAGILSQRTTRPVKALFGGLQEYWRIVGVGASARSAGGDLPAIPSSSGDVVPSQRAAPQGDSQGKPAAPKKRRSAGC